MKLFLDTNVIVDHALARSTGQPMEAKIIISWAYDNKIPLLISQGSFYTFTYLLRRSGVLGEELKIKLRAYLSFLDVANTDKETLLQGLNSSFRDLEDSYQYMTAVQEKCDYLITSNISDFKSNKKHKIKPITPLDFVTQILGKKKGIDY